MAGHNLDPAELQAARKVQAGRVQPSWVGTQSWTTWSGWIPRWKKPSKTHLREEVSERAAARNTKLGPAQAERMPKPNGWTVDQCMTWLEKKTPAFLMTDRGMYILVWPLILTRRRRAASYKDQRRRFGRCGAAGGRPPGTT